MIVYSSKQRKQIKIPFGTHKNRTEVEIAIKGWLNFIVIPNLLIFIKILNECVNVLLFAMNIIRLAFTWARSAHFALLIAFFTFSRRLCWFAPSKDSERFEKNTHDCKRNLWEMRGLHRQKGRGRLGKRWKIRFTLNNLIITVVSSVIIIHDSWEQRNLLQIWIKRFYSLKQQTFAKFKVTGNMSSCIRRCKTVEYCTDANTD